MERKSWTVDGRTVAKSTIPIRWRSNQSFDVGGHPAVVRTMPSHRLSRWFTITLEVDGNPVAPDPGKSDWEA